MTELFVVGAQRSGTTYLYNVLDAHPQVLMAKPVRPEPKYFMNRDEWSKGKEYYESLYYGGRLKEHKYIGEKSTSYIEHKFVAERIKSYYPNARILIILRDPVERAYSNYKFSVEHGIENLSFSDALSAERTRLLTSKYNTSVNPYAYQRRGCYIEYIRNYVEVFGLSQVYTIIHEEFVSSNEAIMEAYSWLGVDKFYLPEDYRGKINESTSTSLNTDELLKYKINLYEKFIESNEQLEEFLGREINAWRR